jgi:excisionase family DNA binding protein
MDNVEKRQNTQSNQLQKLLSLRTAAAYLNIAEITLYRMVESGRIEHRRISKRIMFDPQTLCNYGKVPANE